MEAQGEAYASEQPHPPCLTERPDDRSSSPFCQARSTPLLAALCGQKKEIRSQALFLCSSSTPRGSAEKRQEPRVQAEEWAAGLKGTGGPFCSSWDSCPETGLFEESWNLEALANNTLLLQEKMDLSKLAGILQCPCTLCWHYMKYTAQCMF